MRIFTQPICPRDDSTKNPLWEYSHKLYLRSYRFCIGFLPLVILTHLLLLPLYIYNINLTTGRGEVQIASLSNIGVRDLFSTTIFEPCSVWGECPPMRVYYIFRHYEIGFHFPLHVSHTVGLPALTPSISLTSSGETTVMSPVSTTCQMTWLSLRTSSTLRSKVLLISPILTSWPLRTRT